MIHMNKLSTAGFLFSVLLLTACNNEPAKQTTTVAPADPAKGTYAYDLNFLKKANPDIVELQNDSGTSKLLICPRYQGRVMTSTANGVNGNSFGWINYDLISSGQIKQHINPVGGEERFWLGPEGGQYSIFFSKGDSFNLAHWWVPGFLDTLSYHLDSGASKSQAVFSKNATFANYSGTPFSIEISRKITVLDKAQLEERLKTSVPAGVKFIAYETDNRVKNVGEKDWKKQTGLVSIWLLGMMNPSDETKVIVPFRPIPKARTFITDNYFGAIPSNRLNVKDSVLYFRCDGKARGKIGISPKVAKPIAGSFDFARNILTIIVPVVDKEKPYVNSKWELQKNPYEGDVINSYNDGPQQDGTQMGPFYEIESSSAARELKKNEVMEYRQTTCHFEGDYQAMSNLAKQLLGVSLDEVKQW